MALVVFVVSVCVTVFALWTLMTWFGDRHFRAATRESYERLRQIMTIEVVHFRSQAAWRIPEDPFDGDDDRLGVLYKLEGDVFVMTPLYEFSMPDSGARVPTEVRMRRTPPPNSAQVTEFEQVGSETLALRDELGQWEDLSPTWADNLREIAVVGGMLQMKDLPASWHPIVSAV